MENPPLIAKPNDNFVCNETNPQAVRKFESLCHDIETTLASDPRLPQKPVDIASLGRQLKKEAEEKKSLTLAVTGSARTGKSTTLGKLAFEQDGKLLKNPLPTDDGTSHVTIHLTKLEQADGFSVTFEPLPGDVSHDLRAHFAKKGYEAMQAPAASLALDQLLATGSTPSQAAFPMITPAAIKQVQDKSPGFPKGVLQDHWTQVQEYAVITACYELVAHCLRDLSAFFTLVIRAPWLPDVILYDTPGLGDGKYDPLVKYVLQQSQIIVPCNKGAPIPESQFSDYIRMLATSEAHLLRNAPVFLIIEKFGDRELKTFKQAHDMTTATDEQVKEEFRKQHQTHHYGVKVMNGVEARFATGYGRGFRHDNREQLFKLFRETLLVDAVQEDSGPMLREQLIVELRKRAYFRSQATYLDTLLSFVYQVRNACRLFATTTLKAPRFNFALQSDEKAFTEGFEEEMTDFLQGHFDALDDIEEGQSKQDQVQAMLQDCMQDLVHLVQGLWTQLIGNLWERYRNQCLVRLAEQNILDAEALFDPAVAEMTSQNFASQVREEANNVSLDIVKAVTMLDGIDFDAEGIDLEADEEGLSKLQNKLVEHLMAIPLNWWITKEHVKTVGEAITKVVKKTVFTRPGNAEDPALVAAAKKMVGLCDKAKAAGREMTNVPAGPADVTPRSLKHPLPIFIPDPKVLPSKALAAKRSTDLRRLEVKAMDTVPTALFSSEPWAGRVCKLNLPRMDAGTNQLVVEAEVLQNVLTKIEDYGKHLAHESASTLDLVITVALPNSRHVPIELADTVIDSKTVQAVRSLQIMVADEPTALQVANSFFAKLETGGDKQERFLFVVQTGDKLLPSPALADYSKLLGEHFSKVLAGVGGPEIASPRYFRMHNSIIGCFETISALFDVPSTVPRVMMGLRKLLTWEEKDQLHRRVKALVETWKNNPVDERKRLAAKFKLQDDGMMFMELVAQLGNAPTTEEECRVAFDKIKQDIERPDFPADLRVHIQAELHVGLLSASVESRSHAFHYTANHNIEALQNNSEHLVRANCHVQAYARGSRTYRQTGLVLVNTSAQSPNVWVPSSRTYQFASLVNHLVAKPEPTAASAFSKKQRTDYVRAEGALVAHTLKMMQKRKTVASGDSCVVTDQFTVSVVRPSLLDNIEGGHGAADDDNDDSDDDVPRKSSGKRKSGKRKSTTPSPDQAPSPKGHKPCK
eukprot:m.280942 g.280942  ORF g.280942 m.280942 type:complete len:1204 (-) comp17737_c0_seq9:5604-9215(-)